MEKGEPIAITGIGCRFPGGADDPRAFWALLCRGTDAVTEIPPDRWNIAEYFHPVPGTPGKTYSRWGGFLRASDEFEPEVFGISPREASYMDPQQRLLLEVAWEALEDGGQVVEQLAGTRTGVFVGVSTSDYANIHASPYERPRVDPHAATGGAVSIAAGRLSYCLNLQGPSLAVDTACSSSLVATHLACQSIWTGECDLALAGGVNVIISPSTFVLFCAASMLSPEGRCKAFDATADGFVRSEGAGMVLLKRLSRALADGDPVYAVILASAVNQDGRTAGISAPSRSAQEALIREACRRAGIEPRQLHYVEAHGTGTAVGDPIEATAIGAALSTGRDPDKPCAIGSVKTNLGHLEAAAGIAGLIKTTLALSYRAIPANLHFHTPNPAIPFRELGLRVPTAMEPWPGNGAPAMAGVNSFGFGGTNAHVVLREHRSRHGIHVPELSSRRPATRLLPLSARTPEGLRALATSYRDLLRGDAAVALSDLTYTASARRTHFEHRLSLVGHAPDALADQLDAFLAGESRSGMFRGRRRQPAPRLVGVFSGQGPQWWAMGRQLLDAEPVFRRAIEDCDALLRDHALLRDDPQWSLLDVLLADEEASRLRETSIAQPALFALQVALTALWKSWGVEFEAVVGHSVGEIAAAYVAGALDLEHAVRVIYHRGRCMDLASSKGRMLAVELPEAEARQALHGYEAVVSLAAINSPMSTTLSGDPDALQAISQSLEEQGVFYRFLSVNYAFHSPQMEPVRDGLLSALADLPSRIPDLTLVSTVTGESVITAQLDAEYWWRNVRQEVRFGPAVERLIDQGFDVFIEVGPHPVLSAAVSQCLAHHGRAGSVLPSLRRREDERGTMLAALGALYTLGHPVDWRRWWPEGGRCLHLPTYPWQRQRYWHESESLRELRLQSRVHPLLGRARSSADPSWEVSADPKVLRYLQDHRVQGHMVFPAAAYVELALAVARERLGAGSCVLEDLEFPKALFLPEDGDAATVQTVFYPADTSFAVYSRDAALGASWILHATGTLRTADPAPHRRADLEQFRRALAEEIDAAFCYAGLAAHGLDFGASFQGIERLWRRDGEALGRIALREHLVPEHDSYRFHPAFLDSCFQVVAAAVSRVQAADELRFYLPTRIERVHLHREPPLSVWSHVSLTHESAGALVANIRVFGDDERVVAEITGFRCQAVERAPGDAEGVAPSLWSVAWHHKPLPGPPSVLRSAGDLPGPRALSAMVAPEIDQMNAALGWSSILSRGRLLEPLAIAYIVHALNELGWNSAPGTRIEFETLATRLGIAAQHRLLVRRFLHILAREGHLRPAGPETWEVLREIPEADPVGLWRETLLRLPVALPELTLIASCGSALAAILRGEVDPLQSLFPDGSTTTAEHFFQDSLAFGTSNVVVQRTVRRILDALPADRPMRILEIGAGTGGLTTHVVPELPAHRTEYVFSDVSPFFLSKAQPRFREYPFVRYQLLDLERDPLAQGFAAHGFDVILAANVLHATRDVRESLEHVRTLLAPEGLLALLENDEPPVWADLIFGITEGWWRFSDHDVRPEHPLLPRGAWQTLLAGLGWTDVACVTTSAEERVFVMLARSPALPSVEATDDSARPLADPGCWLILADGAGVGEQLAARLEAGGNTCWLVTPGDGFRRRDGRRAEISPDRREDTERLLESVTAPGSPPFRGVIHLWSLDAALPGATTTASLQRAEALGCHSVMHLLQAFERWEALPRGTQLLLVTRGAQDVGERPVAIGQAPLVGLGRTLIHEYPDLRCKLVDLDPDPTADDILALIAELTTDDPNEEVVLRRGARFVPRLERMVAEALPKARKDPTSADAPSYRLEPPASGVLTSLTLRAAERRHPGRGQVEIEVAAAALNFRDVMKALRLYPGDAEDSMILGDECAGIVTAVGEDVDGVRVGDEVVAIAPGSFASHVTTAAGLVVRKPAHLTFAEAVSMPVAFLTAYYGLHHLARMTAGDRVLIHAAAGGVGLAAVELARLADAEIWATAGSPEKRALLTRLGVRHVMDSRSLAFFDQIMEETDGWGVDIVLNSLAGPALTRSMACLAPDGRFVELGKRDIYGNTKIALRPFRKHIALFAVDLGSAITSRPALIRAMFGDLLRRIEEGALHPLPFRVLPATHIVEAFRYMAQARHVGKVVVSMAGADVRPASGEPTPMAFRADATYLIIGGLGGFGLTVARWIIERGGRHLVLMGRNGANTAGAKEAVETLRRAGARVEVAAADVGSEAQVTSVLAEIRRTMPPLRGVFQSAMVLDDDLLSKLDTRRFRTVTAPKVDGTWNLHVHTLDDPLEHFVLFSSIATLLGAPGQSNYVAANVFLEAIAAYRRALGRPGTAISWGQLSEVGYVARHREIAEYLDRIGLIGLSPREAMEALERLLSLGATHVGVMRLDWHRWAQRVRNRKPPQRLGSIVDAYGASGDGKQARGLRETLQHASPEERRTIIRDYLREQAARVLGAAAASLETDRPFDELGLDSLMAIELKNQLESDLALALPTRELMQVPTVDKLTDALIRLLGGSSAAPVAEENTASIASRLTGGVQKSLVPLGPSGDGPPLFCVHPAGGQIGVYRPLAEALPGQPTCAIPSRVLTGSPVEHESIEEMAEAYAAIIRGRQSHGPYHLLGFSFGGFVAMAIAAALEREGERVAFVGLVDCDLRWVDPSFAPDRALRTIVASMYSLLQRETGWLGSLAREELVELGEIVLGAPPGERAEAAVAWLTARRRLPEDAPIPALKEYLSTHIARVETHLRLIPGFRPTAVLAPLFVWHARAGLSGPSQGQGLWGEYSRAGVVETTIEGSHYEMMAEPYVSELARQITDRLRAVQ